MPNIAIAQPRWSDTQVNRALERELRTGIKLKEAMEHQREIEAAHEAKLDRDARGIKDFGKKVFTMPDWEFFNLVRKYGHDEVHSKEFVRDAQKRFTHLAGARL